MPGRIEDLAQFPIPLPIDRIKRRLKMPRTADFSGYEPRLEKYFSLVDTRARFRDIGLYRETGKIILADGYEMVSESLARHLENCARVSLFGVTVGIFIEEEIQQCQKKGRNLDALMLDALGSECAEEAAIYVSGLIYRTIKKNDCLPTKRFSPGYGDLNLEVQRYFFSNLKLDELGMKLNSSLLMIPQKSITAFIGWRKK